MSGGVYYGKRNVHKGVSSRNKESARIKPHQKIMKIRSSYFYEPEGHSILVWKIEIQSVKI